MKYDKKINLLIGIMFIICISSLTGNIFQAKQLGKYIQRSEYYRGLYETASNREQQLAATVNECFNSVSRTNKLLNEETDTIRGLREKLLKVREEYEIMEDRLLCFYDSNIDRNSNDNDND